MCTKTSYEWVLHPKTRTWTTVISGGGETHRFSCEYGDAFIFGGPDMKGFAIAIKPFNDHRHKELYAVMRSGKIEWGMTQEEIDDYPANAPQVFDIEKAKGLALSGLIEHIRKDLLELGSNPGFCCQDGEKSSSVTEKSTTTKAASAKESK